MRILITILAMAAVALANDEEAQQLLTRSNDQFTAKLFNEVVKKNPGKSVVLSAFSVLTPLAQLELASVGESHDEILKAINLPNDNATKAVFTLVNKNLRSVKGVDLKMASRVYVAKDSVLNEDFAALSRNLFNSDVKNVDFAKNEVTAKDINTWVEGQTNNRIQNLVNPDSLSALTRSVLVNAIYFKGNWENKFDKVNTKDRDFHVAKEKTVQVPTMFRNGDYKYADSPALDAKLLEIPYEGQESSFLIALPNQIDGLPALVEKLKDPAVLHEAVSKMYTSEVDVYLPKFKIETTTDLKEVLQKIEVKRIFNAGQARLDNLLKGESDLYVSEAIQKAFIEVNEEGAEAAAANGFMIQNRIGLPCLEFIADRPFYFELRASKTPLFNGLFIPEMTFIAVGFSAIVSKPPTPVFKADHPFAFALLAKKNILFNGVYAAPH